MSSPAPAHSQFMMADAGRAAGPYEEKPMLPPAVDPQIFLSRQSTPQPFHVICEPDTLLAVFEGTGTIEYPIGAVRFQALEPGDFVYVPARMPHRLVPATDLVIARFRPGRPALEAIAWYCRRCGKEIARAEWNTGDEPPGPAWRRHHDAFRADPAKRTCACGEVHPGDPLP